MTLIRRASPQSRQGSVGWRGVRSWVWEVPGKERVKPKREKHLGDLGKKEDGTIGRAPWIYLAARPGYSWKSAMPVSVAYKSSDL